MKIQSILLAAMLLTATALAQAPEGINYQAIVRDSAGNIVADQNVSLRLTITDGSGGATLYRETHPATTNQFGLVTLNIGSGNPVIGTFSSIAWGAVTPWLHEEIDPLGGSNYIAMGATQLLSVPYALYSSTSDTATIAKNFSGPVLPSQITSGGAAVNQILVWNGINWVAGDDKNTAYTAGAGLNLSGSNSFSIDVSDFLAPPGWNYNSGYTDVIGTNFIIIGVSVNAPQAGRVLVNAQCDLSCTTCADAGEQAICELYVSDTLNGPAVNISRLVIPGPSTGISADRPSFRGSVQNIFIISSSGSHSFYLFGSWSVGNTETFRVARPNISAIFIPY